MKALAGVIALAAATTLHAQFIIPAVAVHRLGISCVTRPTVMAGVPTGLALAGWPGGLSVNPNQPAAVAVLLPGDFPIQPGGVGGRTPANGLNSVVPGFGVATPASGFRSARVEPARPDPATVTARLLAFQQEQAKAGSPAAQYALSVRYRTGDGVDANEQLARIWREAAARNGSAEAARELVSLAR